MKKEEGLLGKKRNSEKNKNTDDILGEDSNFKNQNIQKGENNNNQNNIEESNEYWGCTKKFDMNNNLNVKNNEVSVDSEHSFFNDKLYLNGIKLKNHKHWVNKIVLLNCLPDHNLMSSGADGLIFLYGNYPSFKPLLKIKEFGERGVTYLTELKNSTIIACSFGCLKQFRLIQNKDIIENININITYNYEVINYYVIGSTYITKCIQLIDERLVFISQENNIIVLNKNNDIYDNKIDDYLEPIKIELIPFEICITILELNEDLILTGSITDVKKALANQDIFLQSHTNGNFLVFYDNNFKQIKKIDNIYCNKSPDTIIKYNDKYVLLSLEICINGNNWNTEKGLALIDFHTYEIVSIYETNNQISSLFLIDKNSFFTGDNRGNIEKYIINKTNEITSVKGKRFHQYNIYSLSGKSVFDNNLKKNLFLIFSGSSDKTIIINSFFTE